ncbi:MAG: amidohydrolase family protein [Acidobacteriia bacterium]|nr:amidohydrolase family protein [Terriglobia bacterium]
MKRLVVLLLVAASALPAQGPAAVAIHNARVVPVSGPVIARGTVVLRDGLIEAVGADVNIPADAWVIEGDGLTIYPGLIDALSTFGIPQPATPQANGAAAQQPAAPQITSPLATPGAVTAANPPARGPEDRPMTTSWVRAADLVKPTDRRLNSARAAGFTTAVTFPPRGIFAGQGAIVDLAGETPGQMIVADNAGEYVTLATSGGFGGGFPNSLMGTIAYVRQLYLDAEHYRIAKQFYAAHPRGTARPDYDRALEGVLDAPRVLLPATRRTDVDRMLRFADDLRLQAVLYGLPEGYRSADLLKKAGASVLVNLRWPEKGRDTDPDEPDTLQVLRVRDRAPSTPAVLAQNGVKFALYTGGLERRADLLREIKRALDEGLSPEDALRALTLSPAEIYGVADRLGSIEPGKIANLVVTKGDIFQTATEVKYVFVDGVKFEPVEEPAPANARPESAPPTPEPQGEKQ